MKIISKDEIKQQFLNILNDIGNEKWEVGNCCMVFVYNSIALIGNNDLHVSECVYDDEIKQIVDAFHFVPHLNLFTFDSEDKFIEHALVLKSKYEKVFVYSMAQNLFGVGRRCLIPLLCEYYGFTNISSNSRSSFLGGDKELMSDILTADISMPSRLFLSNLDVNAIKTFKAKHKELILKPNSESASIGVCKIPEVMSDDDLFKLIQTSLNNYCNIFLEEYICGDEVECTVLPWENNLFVGDPVRIIKSTEFLDYKTVAADAYDFEIYDNKDSDMIKQLAFKAYNLLGFDSIARFDFIVRDEKPYLFDITPNPTISYCSSANKAVSFINNDDRTIYLMLLFNKLFVPSLD